MKIGDFDYEYLASQKIHFYYNYTNKFKTSYSKAFFPLHLEEENAAKNALLPFVLFRGNRQHPQTIDLVRNLESLYGTDLSVDVEKRGEWQLITLGIEAVNEDYLPKDSNILPRALGVLSAIVYEPLVEKKKFHPLYFNSEKRTLLEDIKNLKDDKMAYAMERCCQEMCKDEPFSIYKYGDYEKVLDIQNENLFEHYHWFRESVPMHLFYVGNYDKEKLLTVLRDIFPRRSRTELPLKLNTKNKIEEKIIVEEDQVNQSRLTIGYRTHINRGSKKYPHLGVANGILGGFPHSRLFRHVREEKGLAYYIFSSLESTKGILTVSAGIDKKNFLETLNIIDSEIKAIKQGKFSDEELSKTKKSFINQLIVANDSGFDLINIGLLGVINRNPQTISQLIAEIDATEKRDVINAAESIIKDTVYFLHPSEERKLQ